MQLQPPIGVPAFETPIQYVKKEMIDDAAVVLDAPGDAAKRIQGCKVENWNSRLLEVDLGSKKAIKKFIAEFMNPIDVCADDAVDCPIPYIVLDSPEIFRGFCVVGKVLYRTDRLDMPGGTMKRNQWFDWIPSQMPVLIFSQGDDDKALGWRAGTWQLKDVATLAADLKNRFASDHKCAICTLDAQRPDWVEAPGHPIGHPYGPKVAFDIYLVGCGHHVCSTCFDKVPRIQRGSECGRECPTCSTFSFM